MVLGQCYKDNSYTILLQLVMRSAATSQMTLTKRKGCPLSSAPVQLTSFRHFVD